jgi:hypothetical protein
MTDKIYLTPEPPRFGSPLLPPPMPSSNAPESELSENEPERRRQERTQAISEFNWRVRITVADDRHLPEEVIRILGSRDFEGLDWTLSSSPICFGMFQLTVTDEFPTVKHFLRTLTLKTGVIRHSPPLTIAEADIAATTLMLTAERVDPKDK